MSPLDVFSSKSPHQLNVMIARYAECLSSPHHAGNETKNFYRSGTAVDKITYEDKFAIIRRRDDVLGALAFNGVSQPSHQISQFIEAAVNVTDDVERTMLRL